VEKLLCVINNSDRQQFFDDFLPAGQHLQIVVNAALPMNPTDFMLLIVSLVVAIISIATNGWTSPGIGPAILSLAGGIWQFWMQWFRHRSWLRHRDSGFARGTQHLALSAAVGWFTGMIGAMIWLLATQIKR
jgi:hypothetical protein